MIRIFLIGLACISLTCGVAMAQDDPKIITIPDDESVEVAEPPAHGKTVQVPSETPPPANDNPSAEYNGVVLQGLNKVTGHISKIEGPIGTVLNFGSLEIIVQRCWKAAPEEQPENAALMEIRELKAGEGPQRIFLGWMFSSSPGLSGLEHPVYDINVLACETQQDPEKLEKPEKKKAPAAKNPKK